MDMKYPFLVSLRRIYSLVTCHFTALSLFVNFFQYKALICKRDHLGCNIFQLGSQSIKTSYIVSNIAFLCISKSPTPKKLRTGSLHLNLTGSHKNKECILNKFANRLFPEGCTVLLTSHGWGGRAENKKQEYVRLLILN